MHALDIWSNFHFSCHHRCKIVVIFYTSVILYHVTSRSVQVVMPGLQSMMLWTTPGSPRWCSQEIPGPDDSPHDVSPPDPWGGIPASSVYIHHTTSILRLQRNVHTLHVMSPFSQISSFNSWLNFISIWKLWLSLSVNCSKWTTCNVYPGKCILARI